MRIKKSELKRLINEMLVNRDMIVQSYVRDYVRDIANSDVLGDDNYLIDAAKQEDTTTGRLASFLQKKLEDKALTIIRDFDPDPYGEVFGDMDIYQVLDDNPDIQEEIEQYAIQLNNGYISKRDAMVEKLSSNGLTIHGVVEFVDKGYKEIIMKQGTAPAKSYYTGRHIVMDSQKLKITDAKGRGYMNAEGRPGFSVEMENQQNQKYYLYNLEKGKGTEFSDEMEAPEEVKDLFR